MWFYIKKALFSFIYLFFMLFIALGILCIEGDSLNWLKIILLSLNLILYIVIVVILASKDGQEAMKIRNANDIERREIIRTGENRPLKLKEEYKPFKGFLIGFCICIPLIVLLLVHGILLLSGANLNVFGAIASIIYYVVTAFFQVFIESFSGVQYFYSLTFLIVIPIYGIGYMFGGQKIYLQQEKIKKRQKELYGE